VLEELVMDGPDQFSAHYAELLDGVYDCVDRIILNGYYRFACSPAGFRLWWRQLYGDDDNLSNASLQRMSGRFSRRIRAYAKGHDIPVVYTKSKNDPRKHLIADSYRPDDPEFVGLFLVIIGRAPGLVWDIQRSRDGRLRSIARKRSQSWVNHYSFHVIDPDWGHVTFKICGQPPFAAQIMLNGHEHVARQATKAGVVFSKEGNCFTSVSGGAELAKIAETLRSESAVGQLSRLCDRWIYSCCLFFALTPEEQQRSGFLYEYSVYQLEYSRNLLFHRGTELERVVQSVIDRTRSSLHITKVKTLFGYQRRPKFRRNGGQRRRFEAVVEGPVYDLTVFKLHFDKLTLKVYTKGERVLRVEAVAHNVVSLRCPRSLPAFPEIVARLREMLERFLGVLACVDVASISCDAWDTLRAPSRVGETSVPGVDISKPRVRALARAVMALAPQPGGFTINDLTAKVREIARLSANRYSRSNAAYDLRKLRGKGLVAKAPRSHRYIVSSSGLQTLAALMVITDKVIRPVLAGAGRPRRGVPPKYQTSIDSHYERLQVEMRKLFGSLGIAA
jgi:hypothetical protein